MTYGLSAAAQFSNFLFALGMGFVDAVVYYLLELFRKAAGTKKNFFFLQDILFGIAVSVICFVFFQVYCDGQVRLDIIIAAALGFFIFVYCIGRPISKASDKTAPLIRMCFHFIFLPVLSVIKLVIVVFAKSNNLLSKLKNKWIERNFCTKQKQIEKKKQNK